MKKILAAIAVAGMLVLSGCGANFSIKQAAQGCGVSSEKGTVSFAGVQPTDEEAMADVACVLYALNVPDTVVTRIEQTRGIDGVQTASWGNGVDATWSYDGINGLTLTLD